MLGKVGFVWIKDTVLFQYYFTPNQNTVFRYFLLRKCYWTEITLMRTSSFLFGPLFSPLTCLSPPDGPFFNTCARKESHNSKWSLPSGICWYRYLDCSMSRHSVGDWNNIFKWMSNTNRKKTCTAALKKETSAAQRLYCSCQK